MRRGRQGRRPEVPHALLGVLAVVGVLAGAACSDDGAGSTSGTGPAGAPTTADAFGPPECAPADPSLLVDRIEAAIAAVEAERGGPQQYFEINATPVLVNLLVADVDAEVVVPYAFVGDELSSDEPLAGAQGFTFAADALAFDPRRVLSCIADQLPESTLELFFVEGGERGVRYNVLTSNDLGGRLAIEVNGQGQVLSVETV